MSWNLIASKIKFWSQGAWTPALGLLPFSFDENEEFDILSAIFHIYQNGGGSSLLAQAIQNSGGWLRIGEDQTTGNGFVPGDAQNDAYILFSEQSTSATYYFNEHGTLVQGTRVVSLAHEIAHAAGYEDPDGGQQPTDARMNSQD